ncbi:hypothetical protein [Agathobaculum sp.]|uniref:hypothetical protein n=1 Tax=Agathobaculum sp. TaxID=2048138 RepID=UPI003AEFC701
MAEYITKKAAINAVESAPIELFQSEWEEIEEAINTAPAADVVTVVHGRWLHSGCEECSGLEVVKCSECNHEAFAIAFYVCNGNYYPSCGARMDGGADNAAD